MLPFASRHALVRSNVVVTLTAIISCMHCWQECSMLLTSQDQAVCVLPGEGRLHSAPRTAAEQLLETVDPPAQPPKH
jgi:hypothetical protein